MQKELQPQPRGRPAPGAARRPGLPWEIVAVKKLKIEINFFLKNACNFFNIRDTENLIPFLECSCHAVIENI